MPLSPIGYGRAVTTETALDRLVRRERIARVIRAELAAQGRTRGSLAAHLRIRRETLSQRLNPKITHGPRSDWTISQIQAVADFLGVDPAGLIVSGVAA